MKIKTGLILGIMFSLVFINAGLVFSQEATEQGETIAGINNESEIQWLWGEVLTVDTQNKILLVRYLDYETDSEKEISIDIDDETTYENANSIDEIKPQDTVSVDYTVDSEGKNIAKNISVEKPEATPMQLPEDTEIAPENLQPTSPAEE